MITTSITSSWRRALLALAAIALLGTSCQRELALPDVTVQDGQIVFGSEGLGVTVETKATEVTSLSSFYVSAVTGSAGSEASVWNSAKFSQVPGSSPASYTGGKYWPASNPGYKFYGSNVALNFAAEGTYVNASNATDVVCAYLSSPTYNTKNTLSFEHIFARLCRVDVAAQTGYTISNIQMYITPKTGGTYNLRTGAGHTDGTGWSSVATGSATLISNKTGATNNDIYMVPGVYQITCSWISTDPSGASVTYTDKVTSLPIKGGATNNISVVLGGDILLGVDLQDYCEYDYRDNLDYLTFYCDEAGTIGWKCSDASIARTIQYSKDFGATWIELTSTTSGATVAVNAGDIVWFKGSNTAYSNGSYYNQFTLSNKAHVYGNVNSLTGNNTSVSEYCFDRLFNRCSNLYTYEHKKIILPATTLASGCYRSMFERCNYLTTAPELPATTLAQNCYYSMFQGCNSLTSAPALPATTLADYCYYRMFRNCASLTSAPTLPATTLANYCYSGMFNNCTSLTTAPALPATTLAPNCYESMFNYCTSLITAPELPSTTLANGCYSGMFMYCNSLMSAPALPATTLAESCYNCMFYGCTSLMTAPELPATTLESNCYLYMFNGCSSLNYIKALFTTDPSSGSYTTNWVSGVASSGTFVKSVAATWNVTGANGVPTGWTVKAETPGPGQWMDNPSNYLRFKFVTDGQVRWQNVKGDIQYSKNGGAWTAFNGATVSMSAGDEIWFKGDLTGGVGASSEANSSRFITSGKFYVSGNMQSLCSFNNTLQTYHFCHLFSSCRGLNIDVNTPLSLPATTLTNACYYYMFSGCTSLTTAPELPATTLADYCYQNMFSGCISLTTAPELPATTLANRCYTSMFSGCTSLMSTPELPATTLVQYCYQNMFSGCTSLMSTPELPATTLDICCYNSMFFGCTSLMSAPALPAMTLANSCYNGMFKNCSSLMAAPVLPATTLADNCYQSMFENCSSLTSTPVLSATALTNNCYYSMFQNCTSLTTAPALPATTLAKYCYTYMFNGCTSLTTAPELPATTLAQSCYGYMFQNCTLLTSAPELPASTLADYCYSNMFSGCTSLNYIKALFTTLSPSNSTGNWVRGVAPTGTFVKADAATWNVTGINGVPTGWTVVTLAESLAIPGEFSVSSTKKVKFAKGNLQATYNGSSWTWKFAEHQWDYVGNAAGNTSVTATSPFISSNATVDLFGWVGASSTWTGVNQYGITSSTAKNAVDGYGNVATESLKADWGSIPGVVSAYGGGWYTLSSTEWKYVISERISGATVNGTPNARYTEATINTDGISVNGVILFPDGVTIVAGEATTWGKVNGTSNWATKCTSAQWSALESKGCVFLPVAGYRNRASVINVGSSGRYWSSTPNSSDVDYAYTLFFISGGMNPQSGDNRYYGFSVRLAREIN